MHGFGDAFDEIWDPTGAAVPGHLPLLGPHDCDRELAILRANVHRPDAARTILAMLAERNWRPNLVAATAVLFLPADGSFAPALWTAVDEASWVSPQLAAVLSVHDPDFVANALARSRNRCPTTARRWGEGYAGRPNAKALSALVALLADRIAVEVAALRADPEIAALLASDRTEGGDAIALWWRDAMRVLARAK